ncbi:hypothetical protein CC80DRAFT_15259 [Byssothecium circinans]|uniref:Uncharacterized protein n=1 Tax=Byssothecium circinans TaxID=147558 RepID=A0A6A5U105_9PLEO|nr:hypothetical protein CC80DRAFT_15259 [Byssothecium circinans]
MSEAVTILPLMPPYSHVDVYHYRSTLPKRSPHRHTKHLTSPPRLHPISTMPQSHSHLGPTEPSQCRHLGCTSVNNTQCRNLSRVARVRGAAPLRVIYAVFQTLREAPSLLACNKYAWSFLEVYVEGLDSWRQRCCSGDMLGCVTGCEGQGRDVLRGGNCFEAGGVGIIFDWWYPYALVSLK